MHLYVHVPFCARRCSYCDFAIAVRRDVPSRRFVETVLAEWRGWLGHPLLAEHAVLDTLYFGGGTPSRLAPAQLEALVAGLTRARPLAARAEVTLEANPDDVTAAAAAAWRRAGITRVSLGVQSFDPGVLRWMHRGHTPAQSRAAVDTLREAGIEDISIDLIFAVPAALGRDWRRDLSMALLLDVPHLSVYGLTVEPQTPLARWVARGEAAAAPDDAWATEFLLAHEELTRAGYEHYEVSNYARPGFRAEHNSAYWHRRTYLGLGPSAHSAAGHERWWNLREWEAWAAAVEAGESTLEGSESLGADAIRLEGLYLGLRTSDGLARCSIPDPILAAWREQGWADEHGGRVWLTPEGWLRLDALVARLAGAEARTVLAPA